MTQWSRHELDAIGEADEIAISIPLADGTRTRVLPIWAVRVGDELFIRSWRGATGSWYGRATRAGHAHIAASGLDRDVTLEPGDSDLRGEIDRAYESKYASHGDVYVRPMIAVTAAEATLRLLPR